MIYVVWGDFGGSERARKRGSRHVVMDDGCYVVKIWILNSKYW